MFVATGDMSGLIKVWRVDTKEEVWSFEVGDLEVSSCEELMGRQLGLRWVAGGHATPVTLPVPLSAQWMEWHPQAHVLLAGTADGNSWMWKIPSGDCKTFQGPACPATCGRILPDGEAWAYRVGNVTSSVTDPVATICPPASASLC